MDMPALEELEPFGWIFTPAPAPPVDLSPEAAINAAIRGRNGFDDEIEVAFGAYTEKGRYRILPSGHRQTLYRELPVWVITITGASGSRHVVVDAAANHIVTEFLFASGNGHRDATALHEPLAPAALEESRAIALALGDLPADGVTISVEYGSRYLPLPLFLQVVDTWKVTLDTRALGLTPVVNGRAQREVARVVMVDDKAGHVATTQIITA